MSYTTGTGLNRIDLVSSSSNTVDFQIIYSNLSSLFGVDSNLRNGISNNNAAIASLSNNFNGNFSDYCLLSKEVTDVTNINSSLSNYSLSFSNVNIGFSNNFTSILRLSSDTSNLNSGISNLSVLSSNFSSNAVSFSNINTNLSSLFNIDNNLRFGISNNINTITTLSNNVTTLSNNVNSNYNNYCLLSKEITDITNVNNSLSNLSVLSSNFTANSNNIAADINNINSGISNLSLSSSNYLTISGTQTITNKTIDFNLNTILNANGTNSNYVTISQLSSNLSNVNIGYSNNISTISTLSSKQINDVSSLNASTSNLSILSSNYATNNNTMIFTNKTLDYLSNNFLNFPINSNPIFGTSNLIISTSNINSNIPIDISNISNNYKFRTVMSGSDQSMSSSGFTDIAFNSVVYDLASGFNTSTYSYTVKKTGYYSISAGVRVSLNASASAPSRLWGRLIINNGQSSVIESDDDIASQSNWHTIIITGQLLLTVNDVIKINVYNGASLSQNVIVASSWFSGHLISVDTPSSLSVVSSNYITVNNNSFTYAGTGNIFTGQNNSNNYIPYWSSNNSTFLTNGIDLAILDTLTGSNVLTNKTLSSITNNIVANSLYSGTSNVVVINGGSAPASNAVLTAISSSNAIWKTPNTSAGGCVLIASSTNISGLSAFVVSWPANLYNKISFVTNNVKQVSASTGYFCCAISADNGTTYPSGDININAPGTSATTYTYSVGEIFNISNVGIKQCRITSTPGYPSGNNITTGPNYSITSSINTIKFFISVATTTFSQGSVYVYGN